MDTGPLATRLSFDAIFHEMPQASMVLDRDLVFVEANAAYCAAVQRSRDELIGKYVFDAFPDTPERIEKVRQGFNLTLAGETTILSKQPFQLRTEDGRVEDRIWETCQKPLRDRSGKVQFIVQYCEDITQREALRRQRDLISGELAHRVRNTLAVVSSIADQTGTVSTSIEDFLTSFSGRLASISRSFTALSDASWKGLEFTQVVRTELAPFVGEDSQLVKMNGPLLNLSVKATKDLSLVVHELITNASKHGFLTRPEGRLAIDWEVDDEQLDVRWVECGVGPVNEPQTIGFGFQIFDMMPNIQVQRNFTEDGLHQRFRIPIRFISNEVVFQRR